MNEAGNSLVPDCFIFESRVIQGEVDSSINREPPDNMPTFRLQITLPSPLIGFSPSLIQAVFIIPYYHPEV